MAANTDAAVTSDKSAFAPSAFSSFSTFSTFAQGDFQPEAALNALPDASDESTMQWLLSLDDFASHGLFDAAMRDVWALDEMMTLYQAPCDTKREVSVLSSESWKTSVEGSFAPEPSSSFSVTDAYENSVSHNKARISASSRGTRGEPYSDSRLAAKRSTSKPTHSPERSPCGLSPSASPSPSRNSEVLFKLCDTCHHHGIAKYCPEVSCWFRNMPDQIDEASDCDICGGALNAPVPDRKPTGFRCYRCDQHFTRGERFVAHATRHVKLKAFSCDDCGRSFTRRTRMLAHKARYHGSSEN